MNKFISGNEHDESYGHEETVRRRDSVIRRMANTPPQPKPTNPGHRSKRKRKTASGRVARKDHVGRER
jgi:hypothetical protein